MNIKGFTDQEATIETPNDISVAEKPLKSTSSTPNRVDINVLKSKLQETESKELKKKYLCSFIFGLGTGHFRSLSFFMTKFANNQYSWLN